MPAPEKWYRRTREALGIGELVLAAILNVDPSTVEDWDRGERRPGPAARTQLRVLSYLADKAGDEANEVGRQVVAVWMDNGRRQRGRNAAWRYVLDYLQGPAQLDTAPTCYPPELRRQPQ